LEHSSDLRCAGACFSYRDKLQRFLFGGKVDSNTKSLLKLWTVPLLVGPLAIFGMVSAVIRGEYLMPVVVTVFVIGLLLLMWRSKQQAVRFFQDTTPNRAVDHYHRTMTRAPNGEALTACMCGLVLSFYGEYDEARDELSRVSWTKFPPMYDGFRTSFCRSLHSWKRGMFRKPLTWPWRHATYAAHQASSPVLEQVSAVSKLMSSHVNFWPTPQKKVLRQLLRRA